MSHAEPTEDRLTNEIFNSNRVIHFQIGATTEGQSVMLFTGDPDFLNSGSPAAQQGFVQRI